MSKPLKTGLTGSGKQRKGATLVKCLDALHDNRLTLQTLAGLMEGCRYAPGEIDPEVIGDAACLMSEEVKRLRSNLHRLEKEIAT